MTIFHKITNSAKLVILLIIPIYAKSLNNRPRKCLGYKTPFEVFAKMTGKDYFLNGSVALMG
jgi:IS30 family transposase